LSTRSVSRACTTVGAGLFFVLIFGHTAAIAQPGAAGPGAIEDVRSPRGVAELEALHLRAGRIRTDRDVIVRLSDLAERAPIAAGDRFVIQLDGPLTSQRRAALENAGVRIGAYLPVDAYIVTFGPDADPEAMRRVDFVRWGDAFDSSWKLDPDIGARHVTSPERVILQALNSALIWVHLFPDADTDRAIDAIGALPGVAVRSIDAVGGQKVLTLTASLDAVEAITHIADVQYVEEAPEVTMRRNNTVREVVQSGGLDNTPLYNNGLTGFGQVVGIIDGRMDINHCAFSDSVPPGPAHRKVLAFNASNGFISTHGTHVAGIVAGDSGAFNNNRGVAYGAKIVFNTVPGFTDVNSGASLMMRLQTHHDQGARVHTNSWGADFRTDYNGWTRTIDAFSRENEDSVVLFAISNQNFLYTPENAKSVLAVGATQRAPNIHQHCLGGIGPTEDGRRKPEVYAPGCNTVSAQSQTSCSTYSDSGTSMASPAVAGAALLARQYFTDGYYPTGVAAANSPLIPTGALLRALLINSSQNMTGVPGYPSDREGWGRVNANMSLYFPGDPRTLIVRDVRNDSAQALSTGETYSFTFDVQSNAEQLRVTMSFTDVPATIGAAFAPVNDINLEVISPGGTLYRGNVFSGGVSATGGQPDAINSTEQVHVNNPQVGQWTVKVRGAAINAEKQGFAVVVTGAVSDSPSAGVCEGDVNGDNVVDFVDLSAVLTGFGQVGPDLPGDLTGSGSIGFADLSLVLSNFGVVCQGN